MKIHKGDAFVITREMEGFYDLIIVDAFLGNYTPFPLMSVEFIQRLSKITPDKAIISVNCCCAHPSFESQINTYRSVFGDNICRRDGERNSLSTTLYIGKGDIEFPDTIEITKDIENAKIFTLSNP